MEIFEWINSVAPNSTDNASVRPQWKGTDICMDFTCRCGAGMHLDGEFIYYIECPDCHKMYAMPSKIILHEIPDGHVEEAVKSEMMHTEREISPGNWEYAISKAQK